MNSTKKQEDAGIEAKYKYLFEATGTGMGIIEADGTLSLVSSRLAEIIETDISNIVGNSFLTWVDEADMKMLENNHNERLLGKDIPKSYDFRLKTQKGNTRWVSVEVSFSQETGVTVVSVLDIHKYKELEQELKEAIVSQNAVFKAVPDLMFELDSNGRYINIWARNPQELANTKEVLLGRTVNEMLPADASQEVMIALDEAKRTGQSYGRQIHIDTPEGMLWFELSVSPIDKDLNLQHFILLSHNITERKRLEKRLKSLSNSDPLTGLYNRRKLKTTISKEIYKITRNDNPLSLLLFDIDNFKKVNDTFGHESGDLVLNHIAKLVKNAIRESDDAFRYGGEEFVIVMENTTLVDADAFAERLRILIEETIIELSTNERINITVSIGVSDLTATMELPEDLIRLADERMYGAKKAGRNCVVSSGYMDESLFKYRT